MNHVEAAWQMNIPEMLNLISYGLDDMDVDAEGNIYISDSVNAQVYKLASHGILVDSFPVNCTGSDEGCFLSVTGGLDSTFFVADIGGGFVTRMNQFGKVMDEYWTPGVINICGARDGGICVLAESEGIRHIDCYDADGEIAEVYQCPPPPRPGLDTSLINLAADRNSNVYMTYGMPPYRISKLRSDSVQIYELTRAVEYPEDTILISDIAVAPDSGTLYVLLAHKESGLQMLDCFNPQGDYLGAIGLPHSDDLYNILCATNSDLYFLNTGSGHGGGNLMRVPHPAHTDLTPSLTIPEWD